MSYRDQGSTFEPIVKPLVQAANTEHWRESLNVLYLSGNVMAFSEEYRFPCIISGRGPIEEVDLAIDLLKGKTAVTTTQLGKGMIALFMPTLIRFFQQEGIKNAFEENIEANLIPIMTKLFETEYAGVQKDFFQLVIENASSIADYLTIEAFNSLKETREKMIRSAFGDNDEYEEMVDALLKLKLIEPKLQISLCPDCADYEIGLSKTATIQEKCSNCGEDWASITLFTFVPPYEEIKKQNSDLPLFISSYLKHKIISLYPKKTIRIHPLQKLYLGDVVYEVDVYLPDYQVGIECKVFEDSYARMTPTRIHGMVGNLLPQIIRFYEGGIVSVILVTNLGKRSVDKLEKVLKEKLIEAGVTGSFEILHKDMDNLLSWLDKKAEIITNQLAQDFVKSLGFTDQKKKEEE